MIGHGCVMEQFLCINEQLMSMKKRYTGDIIIKTEFCFAECLTD